MCIGDAMQHRLIFPVLQTVQGAFFFFLFNAVTFTGYQQYQKKLRVVIDDALSMSPSFPFSFLQLFLSNFPTQAHLGFFGPLFPVQLPPLSFHCAKLQILLFSSRIFTGTLFQFRLISASQQWNHFFLNSIPRILPACSCTPLSIILRALF